MEGANIKPTIFTLLFIFFLLHQNISVKEAMSADYWPTDSWRHSSPEDQGMASESLANLLLEIQQYDHRIDSVTVVRNGHVVMNGYLSPFQDGLKHIIHSSTKSFMSEIGRAHV